MNRCIWRFALVVSGAFLLAGCSNRETQQALKKSADLDSQKQYQDANNVLLDALHARDEYLRGQNSLPTDAASSDALNKKVAADPEILKMERAQILIYIHMERDDLAAAIYADVLSAHPGDTVINDLMHAKDKELRIDAIRVLGLAAKPEAIDSLAAATKDPDQDVRRAAVVALGSIKGPQTVGPLIEALKDSYWDVRSEAANALGQDHDPRAVKPLIQASSDPEALVETSAETALLFLCKEPNIRADDFAGKLNDPNPKIVRICAVCLALLKDSRAVPVLLQLLQSTDPITRLDAVKGLGETGDRSVIPTLRETLKDPVENIRGWSIIGLGNLRDFGSLDILRQIANDSTQSPDIQKAALAAANHISPPPESAPPTDP